MKTLKISNHFNNNAEKKCDPINIENGEVICSDPKFTISTTCFVQCNLGYETVKNNIECLENGRWNLTEINTCKRSRCSINDGSLIKVRIFENIKTMQSPTKFSIT